MPKAILWLCWSNRNRILENVINRFKSDLIFHSSISIPKTPENLENENNQEILENLENQEIKSIADFFTDFDKEEEDF